MQALQALEVTPPPQRTPGPPAQMGAAVQTPPPKFCGSLRGGRCNPRPPPNKVDSAALPPPNAAGGGA